MLYLNVGGLTNMAIAEGASCRFTRVLGGGLEAMAGEVAERRAVPIDQARERLSTTDLTVSAPVVAPAPAVSQLPAEPVGQAAEGEAGGDEPVAGEEQLAVLATTEQAPTAAAPEEADARTVLASGIREIAGEVRNSLDFHRSQEGGGEVESVVLSGPALEIAGFPEALEAQLGFSVKRRTVELAGTYTPEGISAERLAIATGLAVEEVST